MSVRYIKDEQFEIKTAALFHLTGKGHDLKKQIQ
jgi:hypothetical protein